MKGLVEHVRAKRGIDVSISFCKIGVDGEGGGSFKITLSDDDD